MIIDPQTHSTTRQQIESCPSPTHAPFWVDVAKGAASVLVDVGRGAASILVDVAKGAASILVDVVRGSAPQNLGKMAPQGSTPQKGPPLRLKASLQALSLERVEIMIIPPADPKLQLDAQRGIEPCSPACGRAWGQGV